MLMTTYKTADNDFALGENGGGCSSMLDSRPTSSLCVLLDASSRSSAVDLGSRAGAVGTTRLVALLVVDDHVKGLVQLGRHDDGCVFLKEDELECEVK